MNKSELINYIDSELLDKLTGYCYKRTSNYHEAEELCSEIIFDLIISANRSGEIMSANAYIWSIANKTYADYVRNKSITQSRYVEKEDIENDIDFSYMTEFDLDDGDAEKLRMIYREISFLSKSYRDVMISYYLDEKSIHEIAIEQGTAENTIRQRLFAAREEVRKGVKMENTKKPVTFEYIDFEILGTGAPVTGDPRSVCYSLLSKHVVWLCRNKAVTAKSISETLGVPMPYIENELECQIHGENGKYGMIRKLDNGRYTTNFILLDENEIKEMWQIYREYIPIICRRIKEYVIDNKDKYMAFPYLNRKVDFNLVLWQHIANISTRFESLVRDLLENIYFSDIKKYDRPFSVFGYKRFDESNSFGCGHDGINAKNLCGYSHVNLDNIYLAKLNPHFHCGHDLANDMQIQLAIRALDGIRLVDLNEQEKEATARAIEVGYLYKDNDIVYTKILTATTEAQLNIWEIDNGITKYFLEEAKVVAKQIAECIRKYVPCHLLCDYPLANMLGAIPIIDLVVDNMIEEGLMTLPENDFGAEGCSMWLCK